MCCDVKKLDVKNLKFFVFFVFSVFFGLSLVNGVVEVFSEYDTDLNISSDGKIRVVKDLTLKNVYDSGVVPGQIYFEIGRGEKNDVFLLDEESVSAVDEFGNQISFHIRENDNFSSVVLDVYYPLLPGFEYSFKLSYDLFYKSSGIFFRNIYIPLRESTIPIESGSFRVSLPSKYSFTYLKDSDEMSNLVVERNVATWDIKNDVPNFVGFEYSYIPIRVGGVRGSLFFWVGVNLVLFVVLLFEVKREIRRVRLGDEKKKSKFVFRRGERSKRSGDKKNFR